MGAGGPWAEVEAMVDNVHVSMSKKKIAKIRFQQKKK
jgi:hypothetical protein